jgi:hypothetical protein
VKPRLSLDPEFHPQRVGDGGLDPRFVGVHIDEGNDRDPREEQKSQQGAESDEDILHGEGTSRVRGRIPYCAGPPFRSNIEGTGMASIL